MWLVNGFKGALETLGLFKNNNKTFSIAILGLDDSGKRTLLQRLERTLQIESPHHQPNIQ